MQLWSDNISKETKKEWVKGSYCDKLMNDIKLLKSASTIDKSKCKDCQSAPYDKNYMRCLTCIKHTHYERQKSVKYQ